MTEARPPCGALLTAAKGRHALGREILAYALLPLHCALGYLMYTGTHTLSLALTNRLQLSGSFDDLGPTIYVQASVSILAAILLAVAALVLVPLLAGYYLRGAASGGLAWRVARVMGGQLLYSGDGGSVLANQPVGPPATNDHDARRPAAGRRILAGGRTLARPRPAEATRQLTARLNPPAPPVHAPPAAVT